jgi:serine/threonine-protein kinase
MPSFEIPDGPTTVALKTEGGFHNGTAVFNVTNKTGEGLTARFSVQVQGNGKAEWYSVQGESERPVAAGETQTVTVVAKIPAPAPAAPPPAAKPPAGKPPAASVAKAPAKTPAPSGQHRIKLRATNVNDPDNDSTDSTAATVTIPAAPKPAGKKPFPLWIIAVIAGVLVLVIGVVIAVVVMSGGKKEPEVIPGTPGTPVPKVTGLDYPAAVVELEKAGFKAAPAINETAEGQPLGLVFKQDPEAAVSADPKTTDVKLTVAIGATAIVPAVVDKQYIAAQALLEDRGFTVGPAVVGAASGKAPDTVLTQDPAGEASAPKGSAVALTVDPGVVVPDLVTAQTDGIAGIKTLQNAGLDIGTINSACRGTVDKIVGQSIEPKTKVAKGTKVDITIGSPSRIVNGRSTCLFIIRPDIMLRAQELTPAVKLAPRTQLKVLQPQ